MTDNESPNRRTTTPNDVAFTVRISTKTDRVLGQLADRKRLAKASFVRELIERETSRCQIDRPPERLGEDGSDSRNVL